MRTYFIAASQLGPGLPPTEVTSLVVRSVRVAQPKLTSANVIQIPLVDGGPGTIEHLVRLSLGSFLEVEVKDASGAESVVPLGFVGESNHMAVIESSAVCPVDQLGGIGTTAGIGELILDALDEGAFSVLLGISEPIAGDYGCGMAQVLGVKFFDAADVLLDVITQPTSVSKIARVDATGRSFQIMSARFFGARAESSRALLDPVSTTDIDAVLTNLLTIVKRDMGKEIDMAAVAPSGSGIEFGIQAFLNGTISAGGALMFEAGEIEKQLAAADDPVLIFVMDQAYCADGSEAGSAATHLASLAAKQNIPTIWIGTDSTKPLGDALLDSGKGTLALHYLSEAKLFRAPLAAKSTPSEIRADRIARLDKLIPAIIGEG